MVCKMHPNRSAGVTIFPHIHSQWCLHLMTNNEGCVVCRDTRGDVVMAEAQAGGLPVAAAATGSVPAAVPSPHQTQVRQFAALRHC